LICLRIFDSSKKSTYLKVLGIECKCPFVHYPVPSHCIPCATKRESSPDLAALTAGHNKI
jgi:hypothetical protein